MSLNPAAAPEPVRDEDFLPLSWSLDDSGSDELSVLELPSGAKFIYAARLRSAAALSAKLPERSLIVDADEHLAAALGHRLQTGSAARLDLDGYQAPKSVRELARRGAKKVQLRELPIDAASAARVTPWLQSLRAPDEPQLRYLFRTGFLEAQRAFAAFAPDALPPCALVTLTRYGPGAWHLGLLCRDPAARVGTMEALLVHVIETLQAEHARALNLGEIALDFSARGRGALPRVAPLLKALGKKRYDVDGLHRFKDKFAPVWEPRYVVSNRPIRLRDLVAVARASGMMELLPWSR